MSTSSASHLNVTLSNGLVMPAVGLGTYKILGEETLLTTIKSALANGYRLLDTAKLYENEADIGSALKKLGVKRQDVFITTKLGSSHQGKEKAVAAIEKSLADLGTDYIDLFLIHWPGVDGMDAQDEGIKKLRLESWKVLEDYYNRGIFKAIGVSNYEVRHLEELLATSSVTPHVNQIEVHPHFQNREVIAFCNSKNIHVTAYSSMGKGKLPLLSDKVVCRIAEKLGKTPAQVLLKWGLVKGLSVIPKSVNEDRIRDNIGLDFELGDDDMKALDDIECDAKYAKCDPRTVV